MNVIRHSLSAFPAAVAPLRRSANMKHAVFVLIAVAAVALTSCATVTHSAAPPKLEASQVPLHWEMIIRLRDELATGRSVRCAIYRMFWNGTDRTEVKITDLWLARTQDRHEFIGIYSNGKVLPHGTEVVVIYAPPSQRQPVRAKTTMLYH